MREEWKNINGFQGDYQVSSAGRVRSMKSGMPVIMKQQKNDYGYSVGLRDNHSLCIKNVAKLVAEAFIPNPYEYKFVDYADGNKYNCNMENLFWCSKTERMNGRSCRKAVLQFTLKGDYIQKWDSIVDIKRTLGITGVSAVCRGLQPAAGGFQWQYDDGTDPDKLVISPCENYRERGYRRKIQQCTVDGIVIRVWKSIKEASETLNFPNPENISACLHGKRKTAYGYAWSFEETNYIEL